jgi:hypothetical protein
VTGDTTSLVPGYPIRTSSDPRSVDSSPRHIAASHVLHRLLMPRHPPCALTHLHTKTLNKKHKAKFARCSQPLSNTQTPHPTTKVRRQPPPPPPVPHNTGRRGDGPVVSKPNSVSDDFSPTPQSPRAGTFVVHPVRATTAQHPYTAQRPHNGTAFSWCSLERR